MVLNKNLYIIGCDLIEEIINNTCYFFNDFFFDCYNI